MKKMIFPLLLSIICGCLLAYFMLSQYDRKAPTKPVIGSVSATVYFFQQGVYSSEENMQKNTTNLPYFVYQVIDQKYYVYVGMTKNKENVEKLKGYFTSLGYDTYVKEQDVNDEAFLTVLDQYDALLKASDDNNSIGAIVSQILSKYEEETKS